MGAPVLHGFSDLVRSTICLPIPAVAILSAACGDSVLSVEDISSVTVAPITDTLTAIGDQVRAQTELRDMNGNVVTGIGVQWSSSTPTVATVDVGGVVTAQGNGDAMIRATVGSLSDSTIVVVDQTVTSVTVNFPYDSLFTLGVRARLDAEARDANGAPVPPSHTAPTWEASDETLATIDGDGRLTPLAPGTVTATATVGDVQSTKDLEISPLGAVNVDLSLAEGLQWALEDALPVNQSFGVTAAVILADGSEWEGSTGWNKPGARLRPGALTSPGSIAKAAAGALLLTVIDDGAVSLDDTVGGLVPAFPNVTPSATMRQLLNNSSGIANYAAHPNISDSVFADTARLWTHAELLERFITEPTFAPGDRYLSSNTGFVIALLVASSVTGTSHHVLMRERLFTPLALDATVHLPPWESPLPSDASIGWWVDGTGQLVDFAPFMHTSLLSSRAIGIMASARSWAIFMRDLVAGSLLSPALRDEVLTAIPDDGLIPGQDGAGLGLRRYNYLGSRQWGHSGTVSNGSGLVFHDVNLGVTVAVLFNVHPAAHQSVHFTLAPELLRIVRDHGS